MKRSDLNGSALSHFALRVSRPLLTQRKEDGARLTLAPLYAIAENPILLWLCFLSRRVPILLILRKFLIMNLSSPNDFSFPFILTGFPERVCRRFPKVVLRVPLSKKSDLLLRLVRSSEISENSLGSERCCSLAMLSISSSCAEGKMLFKFHENKYPEYKSRIFIKKLEKDATWLDEDLHLDEN